MTDFPRLNYVVSRPSGGTDNNWHVTDDGDTCVAHCYGFDHDIPTEKSWQSELLPALTIVQVLKRLNWSSSLRISSYEHH